MFFVRRHERGGTSALFASLHPWHELLIPEPLVVAGWLIAADSVRARQQRDTVRGRDVGEQRRRPHITEPDDGDGDEADDTCTICLSAVKGGDGSMGVTTLHCGHRFHPCCLVAWFAAKSSERRCPLCRSVEGSAVGQRPLSPNRPRSLFVSARNVFAWLMLHHEFLNMTSGYGFDRAMALTGSPLLSCALGVGWVLLLHNALPSPRADQNPVQVLLGVRNTPRLLRMWTSWIGSSPGNI